MRYYVLLSNGHTAALELNGSIDWFPCPRFDSPSVFSKILDKEKGGYFEIKPLEDFELYCSYIGNTTAVKNVYLTNKGKINLIDFLPLGLPAIMRIFDSEIPFLVTIKPIFETGLINPAIETRDKGIIFRNPRGKEGLELYIEGDFLIENSSEIFINKGKGYLFLLYTRDLRYGLFSNKSFVYPDPYEALQYFLNFWEDKLADVKKVDEKFKDIYQRSLVTLLSLIYRPSGGIIASPTTSLPEITGDNRNWDYRYVWIRDASYAAEALFKAGLIVDGRRILDFLFSVIDPSSKPFDHPLYPVDGTEPIAEEELEWLSGYKNSRPVRIGNAAYLQIQMDIEGSFMNALYEYYTQTEDEIYLKRNWWAVEAIVDWVKKSWYKKSTSLWEERGLNEHFVHTKVMNWVAMDRASKMAMKLKYKDVALEWKDIGEEIRKDVLSKGYSKELNSFVRFYGSKEVDASLLVLPLYGFIEVNDPRFISTLKKIENDLQIAPYLLLRYKNDFLGKVMYPFVLCSTWLARVYIKLGNLEKAKEILEKIKECATDMLLLGEHIDHNTREPKGNFPHIFSHSGLVIALIEYFEKLKKE